MQTPAAIVLAVLVAPAACSGKSEPSVAENTVVTVSDTAYSLGSQKTESKDDLLRLIKSSAVREPVVVNWSIRGGTESTRKLAQARAEEVRVMLKTAGIRVSDAAVGNEIFEAIQ